MIDSYELFLKEFNISEDQLIEWGIKNTIFPPVEKVRESWKELVYRIENHTGPVYIRGYGNNKTSTENVYGEIDGSGPYLKLYGSVFKDLDVRVDRGRNSIPSKNLEMLTNKKKGKKGDYTSDSTDSIIMNYQVSHIWEGRTNNIFMFEAPWNIAYTPKLMDPFTGHEAIGPLTDRFTQVFQNKAKEQYKEMIEEYNNLIDKYNFCKEIGIWATEIAYQKGHRKGQQFATSATLTFSKINL